MKDKQTVLFGIGVGAGVTAALLLIFLAGVFVGSRSIFPFWERRHTFQDSFIPSRFGHGTVGTIDSVGNNMFVVKDRSGALKTILVDESTVVRKDTVSVKFSDLKKSDQVVVIGEPQEQEGAIKARVVRVITEFVKGASGSALPYVFPGFKRNFSS